MDRDTDTRIEGGEPDTRIRTEDDADAGLARASRPVEVHTQSIRVSDTRPDVGIREARALFGGIDLPATLVGMLTALALVALLGGLITAAIGAIGFQTGLEENEEELGIAGLVGGLVTLFLAYVVGGWAAARIARYDGPRNGFMTGVWTILLAAILAGLAAWLGDEYDVFRNVDLPQWFSRDALTTAAIISGLAAIATMLVAGLLGGAWGERYHRRADAAIASTRTGGLGRDLEVDRR